MKEIQARKMKVQFQVLYRASENSKKPRLMGLIQSLIFSGTNCAIFLIIGLFASNNGQFQSITDQFYPLLNNAKVHAQWPTE